MVKLRPPAYPPGFTRLIAEVADTAMKAIQQPDPYDYIENRAVLDALEIAQLRRGLPLSSRDDPMRSRAIRQDMIRTKVVRDLALHVVAAFHRLERLNDPPNRRPLPRRSSRPSRGGRTTAVPVN